MRQTDNIVSSPLTIPQKEIWFSQMLAPDSSEYHVGGICYLDGRIYPDRFEQAIKHVVKTTDALRLRFFTDENLAPRQYISPECDSPFTFIDLSKSADPEQETQRILYKTLNKPFSLTNDPLFRFKLIQQASRKFIFVFYFHHLITDGWSIALINNLIAENYNLSLRGLAYTGEQDSYLAFVEEDQIYRQSDRYTKQKNFWLDKLQTVPELPFKAKYLDSEKSTKYCGIHDFTFKRSTCNQLEAVAKKINSTLFPAFLGLFYAHLHLIEQAQGCLIGFPTLNRTGKFKRTPGLFTGVSLGYLDFGTQLSFLEVIEKIASELKQNYRNIRFPISEVSRTSKTKDHQKELLFDLTISYEKHPHLYQFGDTFGRGGSFGERPQSIPLDIHIRDYDSNSDLIFELNYNRDYFDAKDIKTFARQLEWLTEQFIANPTASLDQISTVSPEERASLESWNKPAFSLPDNTTVVELFENQVSKVPERTAIIVGEKSLSYGDLNHHANQLAHLLRNRGVGPEQIIGICLERRPELYIAILAVLKAGGAYLPIDPDSPDDRIRYILQDAECTCFLGSGEIQKRISFDQTKWIDIDAIADELESLPGNNFAISCAPDNLAYIIYTSGSTGNPKGVMVEHRSLLNAILAYNQSWAPTPEDRVLQQASIAFDVSVCELFPFLCAGGAVVVSQREIVLDPRKFIDFIEDHQITFLGATPSLLNNLQQIGCKMPRVRKIFSGGESLNFSHIKEFLPFAQVVNGYGPTETTIGATAHIVSQEDAQRIRIPIGKPLPNYEIYILDSRLRLLPPGTQGELCIGGIGLARGYLNRVALTAEKFVECEVFGASKRLYRSGDLARWLPDGNIEFLGRVDQQVKLRGYRIELGEIEAVLASHPEVREAVVVLQNPGSPQARLVAYYVSENQGSQPDITELLEHLVKIIPPYMIPSVLVALEQFPTSTNGKIDRKALPAPELDNETEQKLPETQTERDLVGIWDEVLGSEIESTNVNFFELGGHSLLSTQIISKIRDLYGVEMPFPVFFEKTVLNQQAEWIEQARLSSNSTDVSTITVTDRLEPSLAQLRLLFLAQLDDNTTLYDMFAALELKGVLDEVAFEKSLCKLVENHDSLRFAFPSTRNGSQLIMLDPFNPLTQTDISHLHQDQKTARLKKICAEERDNPVDLERGPLIRFHKIRLESNLQVICMKIHHTISDGWSTNVLFRDWSRFYGNYLKGEEPTDTKPLLQYQDFAAWQKKWIGSPAFERQLAYWKRQLEGLPERIELPTDFPRPQKLRYRGRYYRSKLTEELTSEIKTLGKSHNVTDFMTLLTAFNILLSRYSGQDDFAVGSPIANRNLSQTEEMIGLFVNTLVLRARIKPDHTFGDVLSDTRHTTLQAFHHQDLPLETLVEAINPERSLSYTPLFQVLFVHQPASGDNLNFKGIQPRFLPLEYEVAKFDLTLSVFEEEGQYICEWEYDTDLYTRPTIERMSSHFRILLENLISHPEQPISTFNFLSNEERNQFVHWNETTMPIPENTTCLDLFEKQVADFPDQVAVTFEDVSLTYDQLNRKANRIAHTLRSEGVAKEELVALCMDRSPDAITAILGILKAGAAFIPIDPHLPDNRITYILDDCSAKFLLSHSPVIERLTAEKVKILDVSSLTNNPNTEDFPLLQSASPENLAYLIYTSGSTGKPKAVMIEHLGLLNMVLGYQKRYQPGPHDRALQQASLAFDVAVGEVFCTLCSGATLVMVPKETILDTDHFRAFLKHNCISLFGATPTLLANLRIEKGDLPDIRVIFSGGETANWSSIRQLLQVARIENGYGPTEASISSTVYTIQQKDENRHSIPIGKPLLNYRVFILDKNNQPQPIGVPGELCIAGIGLARGYLNNLKLTEEKFVQAQLFGETERIYKSGDLARWLADGNIEFLGRTDSQIKLRGFRIELGEIENAVLAIDPVKEAVVVVHDKNKIEQLVAYVTLTHPLEDAPRLIKARLQKELPDYMCPNNVWVIPHFPLTSNGKIDKKSLPEPDFDRSEIAHLPPQNEQELKLCELWSELLRRTIQSVNLNFFEAGGHSLLAMQLVSRIRETFEMDIPLSVLFEHPDIQSQAEWVKANQTTNHLTEILPQREGIHRELSFAQKRLWFIEKLNGGDSSYNICTFIHLKGKLNLPMLERTFVSIVERHETLRSRFIEIEGEPVVQIEPVLNPLTVVSTRMDHQGLNSYIKAFSEQPFDLVEGPLFVVHLIPISEDEHALLFKMHHIVSDGWSLELLSNEINRFYNAYVQNAAPTVTPVSIQYGDFAREQKKWLEGPLLTQQLEYWKQQLKGISDRLELPTDYRQPAVMSTRGSYHEQLLSPELSESIQAFSLEHGVTQFMTLLSAFNILLARYSNMEDVVVGSPIANRTRKETENLIGFFVNNLVLRNKIEEKDIFHEFVKKVRKTTLEAYTHQELPFERIVEAINPQRNLSHAPLFQVVFTFRNQSRDPLQLHDLSIRYLFAETKEIPVKNELSLEVYETDGKLVCLWAYCTDLFNHDSICRMAGNFINLLEGLMASPGEPIARISMLTDQDQALIQGWNQTDKDYPFEKTVIRLIQEQTQLHLHHTALEFGKRKLTYLELETESNRIAHYLCELGVGRETSVAVCMDRSLEYTVFILAILKAGGAFVPIDPEFPPSRIKYVIDDSGAHILMTQSHLATRLPEFNGIKVLIAEELEQTCHSRPATLSDAQPAPDDLAYTIYTSGSTGNPKGVLIEHKSLTNLVFAKNECFGLRSSDRYLQQASYAFDFSVMNIFITLCHGATLFTPDKATLLDPIKFKKCLIDRRITVSGTTPSISTNLSYTKAELPDLRLVIFGGEAFQLGHHERSLGEIRIVNAYGPTETTVAVTMHEVGRQDIHRKVPIGKPLANYRTHILNKDLQTLSIGVPGELCVEGLGLARGYLNQHELTADKFVHAQLFGKKVRLYRTGDLARWLPEGNIEFLGRMDHQVKFRGYRFELGEIEAGLLKMNGIKEAVVDLRESDSVQTLVAFVTLDKPLPDLTKTLRDFLKKILPNYMIPAFFVELDMLPLSHTGKIDRKALREQNIHKFSSSDDCVAPRNATEKELARIWQSLLGVEQLSVDENFFDLGGHSLLAPKLIARIEQKFNYCFSLKDLFTFPTLQEQAVLLDETISHTTTKSAESVPDFAQEIILPSDIVPHEKIEIQQIKVPRQILLTGATGFLGTWLLYELLQQTHAKIYCLVRGCKDGTDRIREKLLNHQLWQDSFDSRISILEGDLQAPFLGLDEELFDVLCNSIDAIYHNGAWVNHTYPYQALKAVNIGATLELLKMSCRGRAKAFHFVSTFSAISNAEEDGMDRDRIYEMLSESNHGYAQTKWVSEQLVKEAGNRGLHTIIYRPRRVSGHSKTGDYNPDDFISLLLKGCAQLGKFPIISDSICENLIPVDYLCKILVRLSLIQHSPVQVFNLLNSHSIPWNRLFEKLKSIGSANATFYADWRKELYESPDNALYPFLSVFPPTLVETDVEKTAELEQRHYTRTQEKLSGEGIEIPFINEELLSVYFDKFRTTHYF